ncbi:MAG TPA: cupin domain-containing protein [Gaiellales bacterium]|jgi:quercetin dioxygenase-like cupin family protein|nr:cupin domain-containing protein [Gaiellales bacterium]
MKRWDLTSLPPSSEKRTPRAPRDADRVPRRDGQIPRVLFSAPECRAVAIELAAGEAMGDHHVRERAVVHVASGRVEIEASGESAECGPGTLVTFDPHETHRVRALADSMLLLVLAPWPAAEHYTDAETAHAQELPAHAFVPPLPGGS